MKAFYISILTFFIAGACTKPYNDGRKSIVGSWKLTEYYLSIGGPGEWKPADPKHPSFASFNLDNTVDFNYDGKTTRYRYEIVDSVNIKLVNDQGETGYRYSFKPNELILYPPCIEGCGQKYRPVNGLH